MAISGVGALGGLLFGYDTAVISGAIGYLETHLQLDAAAKGWAASSALVGCIFGAAVASQLGDRFGRKPSLMICGALLAISALWSALPHSLSELAFARILGGVGIGATSVLAPLYLAEIAPAKVRGFLVSLIQRGIVVGIVAAFFVNHLIQRSGTELWNIETGWRWMFAAGVLCFRKSTRNWLDPGSTVSIRRRTVVPKTSWLPIILEPLGPHRRTPAGNNDTGIGAVF